MGNHDIGRAMVQTASALWEQREKTGQEALEILDIACPPHRGRDAEWGGDSRPGHAFAEILKETLTSGPGAERKRRRIP